MKSNITRRDFLNGVAVGAAATAVAPFSALAFNETHSASESYYPPLLNGMRGSHKGSFEVAHALAWHGEKPAQYEALDENYDLVVVGAKRVSSNPVLSLVPKNKLALVTDRQHSSTQHGTRKAFRKPMVYEIVA